MKDNYEFKSCGGLFEDIVNPVTLFGPSKVRLVQHKTFTAIIKPYALVSCYRFLGDASPSYIQYDKRVHHIT